MSTKGAKKKTTKVAKPPRSTAPKPSEVSGTVLSDRLRQFSEELTGVLPGWTYLDSELRVDGEPVAAILGKIGERLVLVHHIVGSKEEVVLAALEQVSRADADARRLARPFELPVDVAPLVVVITEGKVKGIVRRLKSLCPEPLMLFADRRFSSAAGRARFLEELTPRGVVAPGLEEALGALMTGAQKTVESARPAAGLAEVIARVERIDPALIRCGAEGDVSWSLEGEVLCSVALGEGGAVVGRIGVGGVLHAVGAGQALEVFLDWVLARYLELVEGGEEEELRSVELMPHPSEPLLTPEEIAAFQD
jgi:hypothetical protein